MQVVATWRLVIRRARGDWAVLVAALVAMLLATSLLAAAPIYAAAVTLAGLHRTLLDAPTQQSNVQVSAYVSPGQYDTTDDLVTGTAFRAFAATSATIVRSRRSGSFALPGQASSDVTALTAFATFEDLAQHATLIAGRWPAAASSDTVPVAVADPAARRLGLKVGSTLTVRSRQTAGATVDAAVVGIYAVDNPSDPYWWDDPLDTTGVQQSGTFTTVGPLVTSPAAFEQVQGVVAAQVRWRIFPDFDALTVDGVPGLIGAVQGLEGELESGGGQFDITTSLDDILSATQKSLLVTRAGVLLVTVQLVILAGYLLLLTANTLVERRRVQTALLHSRGAGTAQLTSTALVEALALAVPAAVLGPWIASLSLRALDQVGPLAEVSLVLTPVVTRDAYLLAVVAAAGCVLALTLPMVAAARSLATERAVRGRQGSAGLAQRAGIDLMLVVLAVLGLWQLTRFHGAITASVQGSLGIDPFLVAAPAIGLLAGAILALRLVPLVARVLDRNATRQRGLVAALAAWQVSRRPSRYARSALLLVIAVAMGVFTLSYGATWNRSQQDQADYQVGADVRARPDVRFGSSIPPYDLADAQGRLAGVTAAMPVTRDNVSLPGSEPAQLLAVDAELAPSIVSFRRDLSEEPLSGLMARLSHARPTVPSVRIPGTPRSLGVDVAMTVDSSTAPDLTPTVSIVVRDRLGRLYRITAGMFRADGTTQRFAVPLTSPLSGGASATPAYPLDLVQLQLTLVSPVDYPTTGTFRLAGLRADPRPGGGGGTPLRLDWSRFDWAVADTGLSTPATIAAAGTATRHGVRARFASGAGYRQWASFGLTPAGQRPAPAMTAIADESLLAATGTSVGDTLTLDVGGRARSVTLAGVVSGFPTLDPDQPALVVDQQTLAIQQFETNGTVNGADEWWLATAPGTVDTVAAALAAAPYSSPSVLTRSGRTQSLLADPVALGTLGALSLGFVAAALLAAIGFALSAAMAAHERMTQFALLRALGLSRGQLAGWLGRENGMLVAFSLLVGTGLGLVLAHLILPLVASTQAATATVPDVVVTVPWASVLVLDAAILAAILVVVVVLVSLLRRTGLGSSLRMGED